MEVKEFIEKAIEGGFPLDKNWKLVGADKFSVLFENNSGLGHSIPIERIVLDPKSWEAVGKVQEARYEYVCNMHHMVSDLIRGGSIESFIKTL